MSALRVLSGPDQYRRRRRVASLVQGLQLAGWKVAEVTGEDSARLSRLAGPSLFFAERTLILVSEAQGIDVSYVERHYASSSDSLILLLHVEGEVKGALKKFLKNIPKDWHEHFPQVSPWEQVENAVSFCQEELRARGKTINPALLASLIETVGGTDLGFLAYEMLKLDMLLESESTSVVTTEHVRSTLAFSEKASVFPVLDALGVRSTRKVIVALGRVKLTNPGDTTMMVVRLMAPVVGKWASVAALLERGCTPQTVAETLEQNAWFLEQKVVPPAKRWGHVRLVDLVGRLAKVEQYILQGAAQPWACLESGLLTALQS